MKILTPDDVQDLVTLSFCLEPLADKEGCTTRSVDLPGKLLTDFITAGVNVGRYFRTFAVDVQRDASVPLFNQFVPALQESNRLKSPKTVNFGLLEIMFPIVYARLVAHEEESIMSEALAAVSREKSEDVRSLLEARRIAWATSEQTEKRSFTGEAYVNCQSVTAFYEMLHTNYEPDNSNYQWADQYHCGLPLLRTALTILKGTSDVIKGVEQAYRTMLAEEPHVKPGIHADMCAAALFLSLSFRV